MWRPRCRPVEAVSKPVVGESGGDDERGGTDARDEGEHGGEHQDAATAGHGRPRISGGARRAGVSGAVATLATAALHAYVGNQIQVGSQKCMRMNQFGMSIAVQIGRKKALSSRQSPRKIPTVRSPATRRDSGSSREPSRKRDRRRQREDQIGLERDRVELENRAVQVQQPGQVARRDPGQDERLDPDAAALDQPADQPVRGRSRSRRSPAHQISGLAMSRIVATSCHPGRARSTCSSAGSGTAR